MPANPQVIKAMQSLNSKEYVKTQFSWQYYYYTLTPAGLDYLREWLHVPAEIVPQTHIKQQRSHAPPRGLGGDGERRGGGRGGPRGDRGDRGDREGGYRRRDQGGEGKEGGAPGGFAPSFRGGFGAYFATAFSRVGANWVQAVVAVRLPLHSFWRCVVFAMGVIDGGMSQIWSSRGVFALYGIA
jgi:small subunit ribosomal protein S10e